MSSGKNTKDEAKGSGTSNAYPDQGGASSDDKAKRNKDGRNNAKDANAVLSKINGPARKIAVDKNDT